MITLGPFLTRSEHQDSHIDNFAHTGYSMELVFDDTHHLIPIYRDVSHLNGQYASFDDFYFPEPHHGWPVDFMYRFVHEKHAHTGLFVGISPVLKEVFRCLKPAITIEDFLREFRSSIPVSSNREPGRLYKPDCVVNLTEALTEAGFTVSGIVSFGTRLTVDIAWSFGDDYSGWQNIAAAHMDFRPRCGKLNDGKWSRHGWRERIEDHFYNRFEAVQPRKPIDCFRSERDIENLLSHFEWTPTTRHSEQEIRQMRVELVKSARHLWESPKELAALLQKEELYSRSTSLHQIVKFLPSLVKEAEPDGSTHGISAAKSSGYGEIASANKAIPNEPSNNKIK